jgi:glutaredoxin-related protein
LKILSEKGVQGIHLCGYNDLTEVLSYCFSGFEIELLSIIQEKSLLDNLKQSANPTLPELRFGELILLSSLDHRCQLARLFAQQGLKKNQHWVLFS